MLPCASSMQMLPHDVRETSNIANVRIYVEQAIGRLKVFLLLKNELPISLLPLADDIVRVCCALCNLLPPLCMRSAEFVMFSWLLHHAWIAFLQTVHTCSPFTGMLCKGKHDSHQWM